MDEPSVEGADGPQRDAAAVAADRRARVGLTLLVLLLHLPGLGRAELDHEEGRRALPAAEALERGAWIEPAIWGRPYLAKPPGYYWCVAASAVALDGLGLDGGRAHLEGVAPIDLARGPAERPPAGADPLGAVEAPPAAAARPPAEVLPPPAPVTPLAVRLPSVLAALVTVLAVFELTRRSTGRTGALFAGGAVALAPTMISKATLGEIEATLVALTFVGGALAWSGLDRGPLRALAGGVLLGLAVLAKGPIAYAFGLLPVLAAALGPGRAHRGAPRSTRLLRAGLTAVGALAVPGLWLLLLVAGRDGGESLTGTWSGELARGGPTGLGVFLEDRWRLVSGVFAGWLPASLVALAGRRVWGRAPLGRFAVLTVVLGLGLLLVWPGVRARYALPLLPWAAVLAGIAVDAGVPAALAAARGLARLAATLGAAVVVAAPVLAAAGRFAPGRPPLDEPGSATVAVVLAALAGAVGLQWFGRRRWAGLPTDATLALAALALLGARLCERIWIAPLEAHEHGRVAAASLLAERLTGADRPSSIGRWTGFNLLYYAPWDLAWVDDPATLGPGAVVVLGAGQEPEPEARSAGWVPLLEHPSGAPSRLAGRELPAGAVGELRDLSIWRRAGPAR